MGSRAAPYLLSSGGAVNVVFSPTQMYDFAQSGSTYQGLFGIRETLATGPGGLFYLTETDGTVYAFSSFSYSDARAGQFVGSYSPDGSMTVVTGLDSAHFNQIAQIEYFSGSQTLAGDLTPYQTLNIAYGPSGGPANSIASMTLLGSDGSEQRQVVYSYYDGSTSIGAAGCLESAAMYAADSSGTLQFTGMDYYRYAGEQLALVLSPQGYANATAALGTITDSTGSSYLAPYASAAYQDSTLGQVKSAALVTISGLRSYEYSYGVNINLSFGNPIGTTEWFQQWMFDTIEVRPDGTTLAVFSNIAGETMLTDLASADGSQHWLNDSLYGGDTSGYAGQLIETAAPAAIAGYNTADSNLGVTFNTSGEINNFVYATSTTAADSTSQSDGTAGNVAGYEESDSLQDGPSGTPIPQDAYTYVVHTGDVALWSPLVSGLGTGDDASLTVTIYAQASSTVYPDGATADTTSFVRTWYAARVQPFTVTTHLAMPTPQQNGPSAGTQWTTMTVFDPYGNDVWDVDADGNISLSQYDATTGLLMETVANVDTTDLPATLSGAADAVAVPLDSSSDPLFATTASNLADPADLNATTDLSYDSLGDQTLSLGPAFIDAAGDTVRTAQFTSYINTLQSLPAGQGFVGPTVSGNPTGLGTEAATASGFYVQTAVSGDYAAGDYVLMNPISVEVDNLDAQVTDDLQAQAGTISPLPSGEGQGEGGLTVYATSAQDIANVIANAAISPLSYSRWTHYDYESKADAANGFAVGDRMDMRVYNNIEARTFDLTTYGYSAIGSINRTVDPTDTITRIVADARGLTLSTWVGTADAGATDTDPTGGRTGDPTSSSTNNMVEVSSDQYDGGSDGGDGNLTESKAYVDDNPDDARETLYGNDWRDRPLWTMVNDGTVGTPGRYTFTYDTYDNLNEVTNVTRYYNPDDHSPDPTDTTLYVIGRSGAAYDNLGQQYQTIAYNEPGTIAIISNSWFDPDGNTIMTLPGGTQEFTKTVYDGLDEPTIVYTGYDPTNSAVTYATAGSVSGDVILTQTNATYDLAGDDVFDASYNRLPGDTTTTGALAPPPEGGTPAPSQVSYVAAWFDGIGRDVANVNYGACAGVPSSSGPAPASVNTTGATQVSFTQYNARGEDYLDTDPAGRVTKTIDDDAGRTVETIQNYAVDGTGQPVPEADENLVSDSTFHVTQQIASSATLSPYTSSTPIGVGDAEFHFYSQTDPGTGKYELPGGLAYVMYDASTSGFLLVKYDNSGWTAWDGSDWNPLTATASDVLVASVLFSGDGGATVTNLAGSAHILEGVQEGYRSGEITFSSDFGTSAETGGVYYETVTITVNSSGFVPYFTASNNTLYIFGTGIGDSSPALFSNDLLRSVIYADSNNTWADVAGTGSDTYNRVEYTYDRQSETATMEDQNGTTHAYAYDGVGHELSDTITAFGPGIDDSVVSLAFAYKVCGRFLSAESLNADGDVVNEVLDQYDANGNLDAVYQQHNTFDPDVSGAVNTSTSMYVAYGYDTAAYGFRATTLQYPTTGTNDSRVISDSYGADEQHERRNQSA